VFWVRLRHIPTARFVTRHKFAHGRRVRHAETARGFGEPRCSEVEARE
jgi:hypothetical protein